MRKLISILFVFFLLGGFSFVVSGEDSDPVVDAQADYLANGKANSPSTLSESQLASVLEKCKNQGYESVCDNMHGDDFLRAIRTDGGKDLLKPENSQVWARLEKEMSNGGNWMNQEQNRPVFKKFLEGKGLSVPSGFEGKDSKINLLSYDSETGRAVLTTGGTLGVGADRTTININEVKAFGDVSLMENGGVKWKTFNLGHGEFNFDLTKGNKRISLVQPKTSLNNEQEIDFSGFNDVGVKLDVTNVEGKGVFRTKAGLAVDTRVTISSDGTNPIISVKGDDEMEMRNLDQSTIAKVKNCGVVSRVGELPASGSMPSEGKKFTFKTLDGNTDSLPEVRVFDFTKEGARWNPLGNNPDLVGVVKYGGEWDLYTTLNADVSTSDKPAVFIGSFEDNKKRWYNVDWGEEDGRTISVVNPSNKDFVVSGIARESHVRSRYDVLKEAGGRVVATTQDGLGLVFRDPNHLKSGEVALDVGKVDATGKFVRDPKIIGTWRGVAESVGDDDLSSSVVFKDEWNRPTVFAGIGQWWREEQTGFWKHDQVVLTLNTGSDSTPIQDSWKATSINTEMNPSGAVDTTVDTKRTSAITSATQATLVSNIGRDMGRLTKISGGSKYAASSSSSDLNFESILANIEQLGKIFGSDAAKKECEKIESYEFKDGKCVKKK